jgi:hypothetical protein
MRAKDARMVRIQGDKPLPYLPYLFFILTFHPEMHQLGNFFGKLFGFFKILQGNIIQIFG